MKAKMFYKIPKPTRDRILNMVKNGLMTVDEANKELDRLEKEAGR